MGKRDEKNRRDVIFILRLKRKKEERKEELSVRLGEKCTIVRFDRKVGMIGKHPHLLETHLCVKMLMPVSGTLDLQKCAKVRGSKVAFTTLYGNH